MSALPAIDVDLTFRVGEVSFANPVMTASGCGGTGRELNSFSPLAALGAFVTGSVTRDGSGGRPLPRFVETPSGVLSALGLPGAGVDAFLETDLPVLVALGARPIVSIAGATLGEYAEVARSLAAADGVAGVEVNLSAVEPAAGGLRAELARGFARDPVQAARAVAVVRRETPSRLPVLAKLWPGITSVAEMAAAAVQAGADAVVLPGSLPGLALDAVTLRPRLGGGAGTLCGPAIKAVGLYAVWEVRRALPEACIVGAGGIRSGADALEYLAAGANAVQVGSALLSDPSAAGRVVDELRAELANRRLTAAAGAVGSAHLAPVRTGEH